MKQAKVYRGLLAVLVAACLACVTAALCLFAPPVRAAETANGISTSWSFDDASDLGFDGNENARPFAYTEDGYKNGGAAFTLNAVTGGNGDINFKDMFTVTTNVPYRAVLWLKPASGSIENFKLYLNLVYADDGTPEVNQFPEHPMTAAAEPDGEWYKFTADFTVAPAEGTELTSITMTGANLRFKEVAAQQDIVIDELWIGPAADEPADETPAPAPQVLPDSFNFDFNGMTDASETGFGPYFITQSIVDGGVGGSKAMQLVVDCAGNNGMADTSRTIDLLDAEYTVSFAAKVTEGDLGGVKIVLVGDNQFPEYPFSEGTDLGDGWKQYTLTGLTLGKAVPSASFILRFTDTNATVLIDNFSFAPTSVSYDFDGMAAVEEARLSTYFAEPTLVEGGYGGSGKALQLYVHCKDNPDENPEGVRNDLADVSRVVAMANAKYDLSFVAKVTDSGTVGTVKVILAGAYYSETVLTATELGDGWVRYAAKGITFNGEVPALSMILRFTATNATILVDDFSFDVDRSVPSLNSFDFAYTFDSAEELLSGNANVTLGHAEEGYAGGAMRVEVAATAESRDINLFNAPMLANTEYALSFKVKPVSGTFVPKYVSIAEGRLYPDNSDGTVVEALYPSGNSLIGWTYTYEELADGWVQYTLTGVGNSGGFDTYTVSGILRADGTEACTFLLDDVTLTQTDPVFFIEGNAFLRVAMPRGEANDLAYTYKVESYDDGSWTELASGTAERGAFSYTLTKALEGKYIRVTMTDTFDSLVTEYGTYIASVNDTFTVTFQNGDETLGSQAVPSGAKAERPADAEAPAHYAFAGWCTDLDDPEGTAWNFDEDTVTANVTLYAYFTPATYYARLEANGGTLAEENGVEAISGDTYRAAFTYNTAYTLPVPTRTGYTFGGWFTDAEFTGEAVTQIAPGTDSITLYAKWTSTAAVSSIVYELNGGTNAGSNPAEYTEGVGTALAAPSRAGYTFAGWYRDAEFTGEAVTEIGADETGDVKLYAKWVADVPDDAADYNIT